MASESESSEEDEQPAIANPGFAALMGAGDDTDTVDEAEAPPSDTIDGPEAQDDAESSEPISQPAPSAFAALSADAPDETTVADSTQMHRSSDTEHAADNTAISTFAADDVDTHAHADAPDVDGATPAPSAATSSETVSHSKDRDRKKKTKHSKYKGKSSSDDVDAALALVDANDTSGAHQRSDAAPAHSTADDAGSAEPPASKEKKKQQKRNRQKQKYGHDATSDDVDVVLEGLEIPAPTQQQRTGTETKDKEEDKEPGCGNSESTNNEPPNAGNVAAPESGSKPLTKAQKRKQKKQQQRAAKAGQSAEDDVDAVLEELELPKPVEQHQEDTGDNFHTHATDEQENQMNLAVENGEATHEQQQLSKSQKKKHKKKQQHSSDKSNVQDDDVEAVLEELEIPKPAQSQEQKQEAEEKEEATKEMLEQSQQLTKAQKKKQKRKQKQQKSEDDDETGSKAAEHKGEAQNESTKGKDKKKMSAAARKIHEEMERRRRQEELRRQQEEEQRRLEEEERRREEEERQKEEERKRRRKEKEKERKERKKQEGTLLTPKQKEEQKRLEALRRQLTQQKVQASKQAEDDTHSSAQKRAAQARRRQPGKQKNIWNALEEGGKRESSRYLQEWLDKELFTGEGGVYELCLNCESAYANAKEAKMDSDPNHLHSLVSAVLDVFNVCEWLKDESPNAFGAWRKASFETAKMVQECQQQGETKSASDVTGTADAHAVYQSDTAESSQPSSWDALAEEPVQMERQDEQCTHTMGMQKHDDVQASPNGDRSENERGKEVREEKASDASSDEAESSSEESSEEDELEKRVAMSRKRRNERMERAKAARDKNQLRSPVSCILGHVNTGKTKLLDRVRRTSVQDGEAGGITQQIGATFVPGGAIEERTRDIEKDDDYSLDVPGLLVIDTPGHESFSNLRSRGSSLCELAILVVDVMHGLEQQTRESLQLLRKRKTPFVIALNKMDRLYNWTECGEVPFREALEHQGKEVKREYVQRLETVQLALKEEGFNTALYWENPDPRKYVNVVPTSAITGEGIPDLLHLLTSLPQTRMRERLVYYDWPHASVLEVKSVEGHGTTADAILLNGRLKEGDVIVIAGVDGPIVTSVRALLTPQPLKEMRVKSPYQHHKELKAAQGVKVVAHGLEQAVAGAELVVAAEGDEEEQLKREAMEEVESILNNIERASEGVHVQASTLGSLEALLSFLRSDEINIPIASVGIGPVNKKEVVSTSIMRERGKKEYSCILAFDVKVAQEAWDKANEVGVKIFTADIIYHLFDQFSSYIKQVREEKRREAGAKADFPCRLKVLGGYVFNKKDPIVAGVEVLEGIVRVGTKLCVPSQSFIELGRVSSIQDNHKDVTSANKGSNVAVKVVPENQQEAHYAFGRHFDTKDEIATLISRKGIETLKAYFRDDLSREDWALVVKLKKDREAAIGEVI